MRWGWRMRRCTQKRFLTQDQGQRALTALGPVSLSLRFSETAGTGRVTNHPGGHTFGLLDPNLKHSHVNSTVSSCMRRQPARFEFQDPHMVRMVRRLQTGERHARDEATPPGGSHKWKQLVTCPDHQMLNERNLPGSWLRTEA